MSQAIAKLRWIATALLLSFGPMVPISSVQAASPLRIAAPPIGFSRLPDDGIRNRLSGCWALTPINATTCLDGVDRVEVTVDGSSQTARGTFTVTNGRLLLDLSPKDNPANEVYASCAVRISPQFRPTQLLKRFSLGSCAHWNALGLSIRVPANGVISAKLTKSGWIQKDLYLGGGHSIFAAPLRGCWDAQSTRDRRKYVEEAIRKFGGYLSSFQACFDSNTVGKETYTTFDAFDGWDGELNFRIIDGWLETRDGVSIVRCAVTVTDKLLSMDRCATWEKGKSCGLIPISAREPVSFVRLPSKP